MAIDDPAAIQLQQIRNLGKAFYENPATQQQAPEELRKAVELNPQSAQDHLNYGLALLRAGSVAEGIAEIERARELDAAMPHTYFNLGIEYKKLGQAERAITELEQMAKLVPGEAKTHYNLGVLYRQLDRNAEARAAFERTAELDPSLAAPHYQLSNLLRRDDPARARQELARFQQIKEAQGEGANEDVNWSFYSELYDPIEPRLPAVEAARTEFQGETLTQLKGEPRGLALTDLDGDHRPDAIAWSSQSIAIARQGFALITDSPIEDLRYVAVGDANNDNSPELCLVAAGGAHLLALSNGKPSAPPRQLATGDFQAALWVDFDHDYDLDLLLLGGDQVLLRNNGDGTFADLSPSFPFRRGSRALAAAWLELEEDNGFDIVVAYADGVVVYEDRKLGEYTARPLEGVRPETQASRVRLEVVDLNNDGFLDVAMTSFQASGATTQIIENRAGRLHAGARLAGLVGFIDAQNRGWTDAVAGGELLMNRGDWRFEAGDAQGLPQQLVAAGAADFNGDGLNDLVALDAGGSLHLLTNRSQVTNSWVTLTAEGVKNRLLAEGARIEVKAGRIYRKQTFQGAPITFGLAGATTIDTVRITWPNGMIQNESQQASKQVYHYLEKPRLSGSCPMVFTWNGREFQFISEVLGVAPLGASMGDGRFFPVDHDEYVWIDGKDLVSRDGYHEIRITEELREVAYLDQVRLFAVDHPADEEIFTNEKFKGPPFPDFRLFGAKKRHYPSRAADHHGRDVLNRLAKLDRRYADNFQRDFSGRAEMHSVTLDFAPSPGTTTLCCF